MSKSTSSPPKASQEIRGLEMFSASDPQALEQERLALQALHGKPFYIRWLGFARFTGPGWLQSALTLGSGSAIASLFAGAYLQYGLLWVQPVAMLLGVIMLAAISHQTLSTGARPFGVIAKFFHPAVAWLWAFGALLVTIIWHFPQYALAAGMTEEMVAAATGWRPGGGVQTGFLLFIGLVILIISTWITWNYSTGRKGIRLYERILKSMVWVIIITFAVVVIRQAINGAIDWSKVGKGFLPLQIPTSKKGLSLVMAAFAAVVGINSTFLYPYTLLARGWTREHHGLARFDLITGTFLPFCVITSLIIIAAGSTIYDPAITDPSLISPVQAAQVFEKAGLSFFLSRFVFGLGIIGMALSTLTVHMLMSGFAACELLGIEPGGVKYKIACLFPIPGVLGVVLWKSMGQWIVVPTSAACGLLLPFAYILFLILHNSKTYLGADKHRGWKALAWNIGMAAALAVSIASVTYYLYSLFSR